MVGDILIIQVIIIHIMGDIGISMDTSLTMAIILITIIMVIMMVIMEEAIMVMEGIITEGIT